MLVKNRQQSFEQLIATLDMQVQLTESLIESLSSERGVTRTNPFERCMCKCQKHRYLPASLGCVSLALIASKWA
jgi:hypothetical protein